MSTTYNPNPTVPGERIVLTITVDAIPNADAVGVTLPGYGDEGPLTLLDEDLDLARQAAERAFLETLYGTRNVVIVTNDLTRVARPVMDPDSEF